MGDKKQIAIPTHLNFIFGGLASMAATAVVYPLDVVKNRMQLMGMGQTGAVERQTSFKTISFIYANEGFFSFYKGLSAGLLRQATYTSTRLGVFSWLMDLSKGDSNKPVSFAMKTTLGMIAGIAGAIVGTPAEVCLIRMSSDNRLPPAERRNYTNVFNAIYRITKEEGVLVLWRGVGPTVGRAIVVNGCQLGSYSQVKEMLVDYGMEEGLLVHFYASMISGLLTSITSLPIDILKTRIQTMKIVNGVPEYTGSINAMQKIVAQEGISALWKGFTPYYSRLGPNTVLTFIFFEQLMTLYRNSVK